MKDIERIIACHYNEIYHFLCRKLSDNDAAQDVTQTVFVKFIANLSHYNERGKLRNYLFKLAANAGNDWFRKQSNFVSLDNLGELVSDASSPEAIVIHQDTAEAVKRALKKIPAFQRDVIILRFYHNLSFKDIAQITSSRLPSTKSRYRQGMAKLKKLLIEEGLR